VLCDDAPVRFGIVEGEPGIFPDPVARLLRLRARVVLRLLGRRPRPTQGPAADPDRPPDEPARPLQRRLGRLGGQAKSR
jgi:hypothetical protein